MDKSKTNLDVGPIAGSGSRQPDCIESGADAVPGGIGGLSHGSGFRADALPKPGPACAKSGQRDHEPDLAL